MGSIVDRLLENMDNMHELGKQRAFELFKEDGGLWRKEMPTGEIYLVTIEVVYDERGMPVRILDTSIKDVDA
jgi:hypothetical protein